MSSSPDGKVDTERFDAFVDGLDYPMFVVTTASENERSGCLVGFATQASIDPPRMLICLSTANRTYEVARAAPLLGVHVLAPEQRDLAELFGSETGDDLDKFERCSWRSGPGGLPLLDDCPRFMVGRVLEQYELGDHVGFLLEPVDVETSDAPDAITPDAITPDAITPGAITLSDVEDLEPGHPA